MRAVIYARYSSENQREASIDDQVEICRRYVENQGWHLLRTYCDRAISGASDQRASYQQMLVDAEAGDFDVIVCEALDRLGRRLSDVARLFDRLEFRRQRLDTVAFGRVTTMHVGLLGTMAQLYLSDLREKTRRGQLGRALAGKMPGGKAYGYLVVAGQPGERRINEVEASVVSRIFREFASGKSPGAIARQLNAEGIPGPEGREWRDTTIRGQVDRGTGILNNAIYVGRLEWNRCSYVKDPNTGKRVARPNPNDAWEQVEIPELRIVDDGVWSAVKTRQFKNTQRVSTTGRTNPLNDTHRPRFLFSGLLKCGLCGGGYTIVAKGRYGCATRRSKGTCENRVTITRKEIEQRILGGLKDRLMSPEIVREFTREVQREINKAAAERQQERSHHQRRLSEVDRKIGAIVSAIENGGYNRTLRDRLTALEREKASLQASAHEDATPIVRLHPRLADIYAEKVADLELSLNDPFVRDDAHELLRSLVEKVELTPRTNGRGLDALLFGDLAGILSLCAAKRAKKSAAKTAESSGILSVVAGAGSTVR